MNTTRILVVCCCLALLVAPAGAHPGSGHEHGGVLDYALGVDGSVPTAGLPADLGLAGLAGTPVSAVVGALRDETIAATVRAPADARPRLELRDARGRIVAEPAVENAAAEVRLDGLAPGSYVLAVRDEQGLERDAVAVLVARVGVSHTAVDRSDAGTSVPVQVTSYGPPETVADVDIVLASAGTTTVVPATALRTGLHAATLRLDVPPGPYSLFAVVRDADGAVVALSAASEFEVYTVDGVRVDTTPTPTPATPDAAGTGTGTDVETPAGDASAGRPGLAIAADSLPVPVPVLGAVAVALAGLVIAGVLVRRRR